ncbi:MAG: glycosyltransferase family 2 protein, partial [Turicibacter sp.]|nr:glycosyltransferase family 2 protein [Turicibacter sp.]
MENIRFSIVVPVYNAAAFIVNCMESVRNQEYKNFELILVNDGSIDDSEKIIDKYKESHKEIAIIYSYQKNQGAAVARGNGLLLATGDYIAFLDADDIWYSNKLSTYYQYIINNKGTFFYGDEYEVSIDGKKEERRYRQLGDKAVIELITGSNPISTSTVVVEKNFLLKAHTFFDNKKAGEDIACWISLAKAGAKFVHIPEIVGEYRRNEKSLTMCDEEFMKETYERLLEFYDFLTEYDYSLEKINELKTNQKAKNAYSMARFHHRRNEYKKARNYY